MTSMPNPQQFCPVSLEDWLELCQSAGIPHVPATRIATIGREDCLRFDSPGEHQDRLHAAMKQVEDALHPGHMLRFDCCAPIETKSRLARGLHEWHPNMNAFMLDDPRLFDILCEYPKEEVPIWTRPWQDAEIVSGYPVEYRAFVLDGQVAGISSYYPQRPLPRFQQHLDDVLELTLRLIDHIPTPFLWIEAFSLPAFGEKHDLNGVHFTADFIAARGTHEILFLEGGPPHELGGHPCCFLKGEIDGVALENRNQEPA